LKEYLFLFVSLPLGEFQEEEVVKQRGGEQFVNSEAIILLG
jgi:hypothetical protein